MSAKNLRRGRLTCQQPRKPHQTFHYFGEKVSKIIFDMTAPRKTPQRRKKTTAPSTRQRAAAAEYARLVELFGAAGVDELKLKIYDSLLAKVAELYGILCAMADLPTLKAAAGGGTLETGAGKARVKYMAQYANCMIKLERALMGVLSDQDDEALKDFEND